MHVTSNFQVYFDLSTGADLCVNLDILTPHFVGAAGLLHWSSPSVRLGVRPSVIQLALISSYTVRTTTLKLYHIEDICNIAAVHYLEFSYRPWIKSCGAGKTGGVKNVHLRLLYDDNFFFISQSISFILVMNNFYNITVTWNFFCFHYLYATHPT